MRFNQWMTYLSTGLMMASAQLSAQTPTVHEQLQVPLCLAAHVSSDYPVLAGNAAFKIIDLPAADMNKMALLADKIHCGRFVNVSHLLAGKTLASRRAAAIQLLAKTATPKPVKAGKGSYPIEHQTAVFSAIGDVDVDNILATLTHLTHYKNRAPTEQTGVDTANWLKSSFENFAKQYGRDDTKTYFVKTGSYYKQPSLVTVIGSNIDAPGIVIGAHMDTLEGRMPGAGDDGSGSSSVMEMARIMLASNIPLKRPVYFIWYSAEEQGLVGSQYVVEHFMEHGIPVKAAIQFDMTGFRNDRSDPTMWVYRDYTDNKLSDFVSKLIETYVGVPVAESSCGYGCSDHASWMEEGIPAAFPCETAFENHNQAIHSDKDTMDRLTPAHMANFAKLGLAFAIELAAK